MFRGAGAGQSPIRLAHRTRAAAPIKLRGKTLTGFGGYTLLKKRIGPCAPAIVTLRGRRIHPHTTLRHTTAAHLLKAGIGFATISRWLGDASLTTMVYARADLHLKRQALVQVFPDAPSLPRGGRVGLDKVDAVDW